MTLMTDLGQLGGLESSKEGVCVKSLLSGFVLFMAASSAAIAQTQLPAERRTHSVEQTTFYHTVKVDGLSIFYREAGPQGCANDSVATRASFVIADV